MASRSLNIGIRRFKGFERLQGDSRWNLQQLLENIDQATIEIENEKIDWSGLWVEKLRRSSNAISDLIAANGQIADILDRGPLPPLLSDWEVLFDESFLPRLEGLSFGHPVLSGSGRPIYTSLLLYIDLEQGFARTLSRYYRLGQKRGKQCDA